MSGLLALFSMWNRASKLLVGINSTSNLLSCFKKSRLLFLKQIACESWQIKQFALFAFCITILVVLAAMDATVIFVFGCWTKSCRLGSLLLESLRPGSIDKAGRGTSTTTSRTLVSNLWSTHNSGKISRQQILWKPGSISQCQRAMWASRTCCGPNIFWKHTARTSSARDQPVTARRREESGVGISWIRSKR